MRRTSLAVALLGAAALTACGRGPQPSTAGGISRGRTGQYYYVNLFTPPLGGVVTSDVGGIACGASAAAVDGSVTPPRYVYTYYGEGVARTDHCGQTQVPWDRRVTLTAAGRDGNAFLGWAGDCAGSGPCTLSPGADKTVVALFGPPGSGHPNFTDPATHGPAYLAFLAGESPLRCTGCHGSALGGQGIAPSCATCHAAAGWADWRASCSFCHGARTAAARAGYALADHPAWAAPPDAVSQRLTGVPAPDRTGAHQAHLTGATPGGLSVAPPFRCETCHPVPSDHAHVSGAAGRAEVVLSGAGQASLPASLGTYDPVAGTCATSCHGAAPSPAWSSTGLACGGCHGVPPPDPHPFTGADLTACAACHGETMGPDGRLLPGGTHVDGLLQATGGHPDFSQPSVHGPAFFEALRGTGLDCKACHGLDLGGGAAPSCNACHLAAGWTVSWQGNCSFCHGVRSASTKTVPYTLATSPTLSAPPDALSQRLTGAPAPERTGAHAAHLTGLGSATGFRFSAPIPCQVCHTVPTDLAHAGGPGRAPVTLRGLGALPASLGSYAPATGTCTTYCHGSTMVSERGGPLAPPTWTGGQQGCSSCHGYPPDTGLHGLHVTDMGWWCADCHAGTVTFPDGFPQGQIIGLHVDGAAEVRFFTPGSTWNGARCTASCHVDPAEGFSWR